MNKISNRVLRERLNIAYGIHICKDIYVKIDWDDLKLKNVFENCGNHHMNLTVLLEFNLKESNPT